MTASITNEAVDELGLTVGQQAYAVATIGLMGIREPQALRYDA